MRSTFKDSSWVRLCLRNETPLFEAIRAENLHCFVFKLSKRVLGAQGFIGFLGFRRFFQALDGCIPQKITCITSIL